MPRDIRVWPSPSAYNPEHAPHCGMCIGSVMNMDTTSLVSVVAIKEAATRVKETIDPLTIFQGNQPIGLEFGIYPPAEVAEVVRALEDQLAEVEHFVPLAHMLVTTPWLEFEYPDIAFQDSTSGALISSAERRQAFGF